MSFEEDFTFPIKVQDENINAKYEDLSPSASLEDIIERINQIQRKNQMKIGGMQCDIEKLKQYILIIGQKISSKHEAGSQERSFKKQRRTAEQIERNFRCPVSNCGKAYGSQSSLKCHMKLKHKEVNLNLLQLVENSSSDFKDDQKFNPPATEKILSTNQKGIAKQGEKEQFIINLVPQVSQKEKGNEEFSKGAFKKFLRNN